MPVLGRQGGRVSYLFELEDVLVEVVLETFIGEVDAELLKAVVFVIFETKNVEHSDGQDLGEATRATKYFILEMMHELKKFSLMTLVTVIQQNPKTITVRVIVPWWSPQGP